MFLAKQRAVKTCPSFGQPPALIWTRTLALYSAKTCFVEYVNTCFARKQAVSFPLSLLVALHTCPYDRCVLSLFCCTDEMRIGVSASLLQKGAKRMCPLACRYCSCSGHTRFSSRKKRFLSLLCCKSSIMFN